MQTLIGIDIGGTAIKADLYNEKGDSLNVFKEVSTQIDHNKGTNNILGQICDLITDYCKNYEINGVGISSAGVINSETGEVVYAGYTIPGYIGTDFKKTIREKFALPVSVENDVNSAALGESWLGNAKGMKNVVMITVGTGIGAGVIINDQIVNGHRFTAGEIGYLRVAGHDWQKLASTTALVEMYEKKSGKTKQDGRLFFTAVKNEDPLALETLDIFIDHLTEGLLSISYLLNPDGIVLGGGIFSEPDFLLASIQKSLFEKVQDERFLPKRILAASLGNAAGRIGAIRHFLNQHSL